MRKILFIFILLCGIILSLQNKNNIIIWGEEILSSSLSDNKQTFLTSVGTLITQNSTDITSSVSGIVKEINIKPGQFVKKGDVLVVLKQNVKSFSFSLQNKKLIIENKIFAPSDGKISLCQINFGEYISAGTPLIKLQLLRPLYVQFTLPEKNLPQLYLQQPIDVVVNLSGREIVTHGSIHAIYAKINEKTHQILIQAKISNRQLELHPGMFAFVKIWLTAQNNN